MDEPLELRLPASPNKVDPPAAGPSSPPRPSACHPYVSALAPPALVPQASPGSIATPWLLPPSGSLVPTAPPWLRPSSSLRLHLGSSLPWASPGSLVPTATPWLLPPSGSTRLLHPYGSALAPHSLGLHKAPFGCILVNPHPVCATDSWTFHILPPWIFHVLLSPIGSLSAPRALLSMASAPSVVPWMSSANTPSWLIPPSTPPWACSGVPHVHS